MVVEGSSVFLLRAAKCSSQSLLRTPKLPLLILSLSGSLAALKTLWWFLSYLHVGLSFLVLVFLEPMGVHQSERCLFCCDPCHPPVQSQLSKPSKCGPCYWRLWCAWEPISSTETGAFCFSSFPLPDIPPHPVTQFPTLSPEQHWIGIIKIFATSTLFYPQELSEGFVEWTE